jgi:prepilin-type N-terminal cleavage/methylation domain-containing protein
MKKNKKGFTLAELLIVVAIIGVLVAISIPIFTNQLEKAREATDAANIRSQYAQVMAEAIMDGGAVNGKDMFGAVELKQKKKEWQNTELKQNLEGAYGDVIGDYPKADGTAWVEYDGEKAILHYENGSGSGSGSGNSGNAGGNSEGSDNTSGGSGTSGNTGGNSGSSASGSESSDTSENTGGNSGSGGSSSESSGTSENTGGNSESSGSASGGSGNSQNTGGGSESESGESNVLGALAEQIDKSKVCDLPESISEGSTFSIKQGNIYGYKGKKYVALTSQDFNHWYNPNPDNSQLYVLLEINSDTQILDSNSDRSNGIKTGQLYRKDDGSFWIRAYSSDAGWVVPPDGANWQKINLSS